MILVVIDVLHFVLVLPANGRREAESLAHGLHHPSTCIILAFQGVVFMVFVEAFVFIYGPLPNMSETVVIARAARTAVHEAAVSIP
jgi:hypothetical protein